MLSSKITSKRQYEHTSKRQYEHVTPSIVIPDHFVCNQETKMVVLYDVPVGDESEKVTLQFPGDMVGSSPRQIATKRVGSQSVVFNTPVYSTSRGQVEVTPILETRKGSKIQMGKFRLTLKHPLTTAMELCMKLSTSNAVLPILTTLMLSASGDKEDQFKDPHTDRVMTLLVGSMKPGSSCTIKNVLLPDKKWRKKHLIDLARQFGLRSMEKEAYMLNAPRMRAYAKRSETIIKPDEVASAVNSSAREAVISSSFSSPNINTAGLDTDADLEPFEFERISMCNQLENNTEQAYIVIQDFYTQQMGKISLKVGQKVYVITFHSSNDGWWYGACKGRHGMFPASCVEAIYDQKKHAPRLPLPPLPRKPQAEVEKRLSLPFKGPPTLQKMLPAMGQMRGQPLSVFSKVYKKPADAKLSPLSSTDTSRNGSKDLLSESISSESAEYVDMVTREKNYSTYSESDNESSSVSTEDQPTTSSQQKHWTRKFRDSSPQSPVKKQPILLPTRKVLRSIARSTQHSPQSSRLQLTAPIPPTRTTSVKPTYDETFESETNQSVEEDSSEDDDIDYMNIHAGLPLTKSQLEQKYENFNPRKFDLVHGHMYDRPDVSSPEEQTFLPPTKTAQYPIIDTMWQPDGRELEARRHARHVARGTHENVVLSKVRPAPLPPIKRTAQSGFQATPSSKQELQAKNTQDWTK